MSERPAASDPERDGLLFGRDVELREITDFLHRAATRGDALLLTGDPGVGKSSLLEVAVHTVAANGGRVVRARGVQFRAAVTFSGLDQLVAPLRAHLDDLSPAHRRALTVALGLTGGQPSGISVVANAALALFRRTAEQHPLLIAVDDAHWLDPASTSVLAFLARRLSGSRVGFLAASRTEPSGVLDSSGLPEVQLKPLDEESAAALLGTHFPLLAAPVQQRLLLEAEGNPLALLELPNGLNPAQQRAREPLPETLVLNRRLDRLFGDRLDAMPEPTGALLLLIALEGSGNLDLLQATQTHDVLPLLAPAERARLVFVDQARRKADFRHSLIGAAVVDRSLSLERRRAHHRLAEVLPLHSEGRAWHLAEASVEPNEAVAGLLDEAARRSRARGDVTGALTALTKAAHLSTDQHAQARRLLAAAYLGADLTGDLQIACQLIEEATAVQPQIVASLPAAVAAANLLLNAECEIDAAHRLLTEAIDSHSAREDAGDETLVDALHTLILVCWVGARPAWWKSFDDQLARLKPAPPPLLQLCARSFGDPVRQAAAGLSRLDDTIADLTDLRDPIDITRVGTAAVYTDRMSRCRPALQRVIADGRRGRAVALAINATVSSCVDDWQRGRWDEALELCQEGLTLSRRYGYHRYTFVLSGYLEALIRAVRGDHELALVAAHQMVDWAESRGAGIAVTFAHHIEAMAAQGAGDYEAAYRAAATICPPGVLPKYSPHVLWILLDLVEAAVRTNRQAQAEAYVAAMEAAGIARISSRLALVVGACSAFAMRGPEALERFATALAVPGAAGWKFDHARVQLAYGERLGQAMAIGAAREQFLAALSTFEELDARPWADRARRALQATGLTVAPDGTRWIVSLTPQELEVAELAASGLSNKQIGQLLFLSPRTVSTRLYHLFPKLGITTRAALRDALNEVMQHGGPGSEPTRAERHQ